MSKKVLKWLILIALLLLIASIFSFWFSGPSFREKDIELKIDGPTQAAVGDEVVYKLTYSNNTKLNLYDLKFSFYYPQDSVVIKDGDVQNDLTERFDVDELGSGKSETKEFHAFIVGSRGDTKDAKADLSFRAENLRSSFEKKVTLSTTIISVPISLTIVAPPNVVPGESIDYILDYRNESNNAMQDLLFEFTFPEGFSPKDFSPQPNAGSYKWRIDSLRKNGAGRISIKGTLSGKEGDSKTIQVVLKRKVNDKYVDFEKASSFSVVSSPLLDLDISVNNSKNFIANPGNDLNYSINYKNNSNVSLSGLTLSVKLEGDMYDLSSLDTRGGFFDSSNKKIIWGPSNVSDLSNLPSGASGTITFYIRLKSDFDAQGSNTLFVRSSAKLSTSNVPEGVDGSEVSTSSNIVTNITKQPTLTQQINSNGGDIYTVRWVISNPGNSVNNALMSVTLPDGVSWNNIFNSNVALESPKFMSETNNLTWNIGTIPGGIGSLMPKYELEFQVSTKSPPEIKNAELAGVDSVTGQSIIVR